jgi:hypothetical protein
MLWHVGPLEFHPLLKDLGPEPLSDGFDGDILHAAIAKRGSAIKLAIMDNHVVVGVGNIYANESLFHAGINPTRPRPELADCRRLPPKSNRCSGWPSRRRQHAARLRQYGWQVRLLSAGLLCVRPARGSLSHL